MRIGDTEGAMQKNHVIDHPKYYKQTTPLPVSLPPPCLHLPDSSVVLLEAAASSRGFTEPRHPGLPGRDTVRGRKCVKKETSRPSFLCLDILPSQQPCCQCVWGWLCRVSKSSIKRSRTLDCYKHFDVKPEAFRDFSPPNIRMRVGFFDVWISHLCIMKIPNDI